MPAKGSFAIFALCLCSAMTIADRAASQSAQPAPAAPQPDTKQPESAQSGYVLKVTTRLVTLDLIATDSHGNPVRDLKPEDLQIIEDRKAQQKIEHFEYIEKPEGAPGNSARRNRGNIISNQLPLDELKIPPTVLLMDSLNTQTANQQQGRAHMIELLRSLPQDTPIAVFLLGSSLRILQGFTSDESLLRAALDRAEAGKHDDEGPAHRHPKHFQLYREHHRGHGHEPGAGGSVGRSAEF